MITKSVNSKRKIKKLWKLIYTFLLVISMLAMNLPLVDAMMAALDQFQTDTTSLAGIFQYGWTAIGQDFTAGKTGSLTKISLYLSTPYYGYPDYNADITLEVRTQYNAGTVLATTTSYFSGSAGGTWVDFDFASPVPVTAGTKYTFKCIPTASNSLAIHHSSADVYPGQAFYSLSSGSYSYFHADWSFKTYVYESAPTYALSVAVTPAGSGTATDTSGGSPYASGTIVNISATPSSGYSFVSWTDSPADGTFGSTTSATTTYTMPAQAETVTANFAANTYTVTFASQGGSAPEPGSKTVAYASAYGTLPEVTRSGYTFNGWYTEATGGTEVTSYTTVTTADNHTLYAQWTTLPTYTVTYDGNENTGGTVPVDNTNYLTSDTVTVLGNTSSLEKTSYTFAGWNTAPDGSGTPYNAGESFDMGTANVTLYAQWTALPTYTVTYDGNGNTGGTVPVDNTNYLTSDTVTVLGNTGSLEKTSYTFAGWNTAPDGSGTPYNAGESFDMDTANVTLYAQWTVLPTYTVTYNGNGNTGGTVPVDNTNYLTSDMVTVLGNTGSLEKTDYTFAGWNTATDGSGIRYAGDDTFVMGSSNVTLYAQWEAIPPTSGYIVSVSANLTDAGTVTGGGNYETGDRVKVSATANENYAFIHWTEGSTVVTKGATYNFRMGTENRSLVAHFEATVPTTSWLVSVSAKPSGSGVVSGGGMYEEGDLVKVIATANDGYRFNNWTEGLTEVSTDAAYSFTMDAEARSLTANFLPEGQTAGWSSRIKLSTTAVTATSVTLQLTQSVPDAVFYLVYNGDVLLKTFDAESFTAMQLDELLPATTYTFTVQALYPDGSETSDGPSVKVKTKK